MAALAVLGAIAIIGAAATHRSPQLERTWGTFASSVAALPSAFAGPSAERADASASLPDAASQRRQSAPLSSAQLGAPLVHGGFVSACGAPPDMKVVVKATVRMGHAVEVAVTTQPPSPTVASCVEKAARSLRWDISPKTEKVTVTY